MISIPNHEAVEELRRIDGQRLVLRTRAAGLGECTTRVILSDRVDPRYGETVRTIVCAGRGSVPGLAEGVALTLEGYKVAASLPLALWTSVAAVDGQLDRSAALPSGYGWSYRRPEVDEPRPSGRPPPEEVFGGLRWARLPVEARWQWRTEAVDAGVTPDGYVFVSTRFIDGTPISALPEATLRNSGLSLAWNVALILAELHAHNVAYGDLKAANLVLTPTGRVVLIDLDTLREVGGPGVPSRTRDATRNWAAPEQLSRQETWLASDVWSYAKLLETFFPLPQGLPPQLVEVWRACRMQDPFRRVNTRSLLARMTTVWLESLGANTRYGLPVEIGQGGLVDWMERDTPSPEEPTTGPVSVMVAEETDRVYTGRMEADAVPVPPIATDRLDEPPLPSPVAPRPAAAVAPRRGCGGWLVLSILAGGVGLAVLIGLVFVGMRWSDESSANTQAAALLADLKRHKVDRKLNTDAEIGRIRADADAAWALAHTPRTCAIRALATIWDDGWHRDLNWDAARFDADLQVTREAPCDDAPEVLLARGTLATYACINKDPKLPSFADCELALTTLGALREDLPTSEDWHWLRIEAMWQEARVRRTLGKRYHDTGNAEKTAMLAAAQKVCDDALPIIDFAPVNGPEMLESCLPIAGLVGSVDRFVVWSEAMLALPMPSSTTGKKTRLAHLYRDWGDECGKAKVDRRKTTWTFEGPDWCVALGHVARGCPGEALSLIDRQPFDEPHEWTTLRERALATPPTRVCLQ